MTTIKQVKETVQPLLERHADLALVGRYLILTPVRHFVRGVLIDASGDRNIFVPATSVCLTFDGDATQGIGWGDHLIYLSFEEADPDLFYKRRNDPRFGKWDTRYPENIELMLRFIEASLEPLREMTTFEQMTAFAQRPENNLTPFEFMYYARFLLAAAIGDFETARHIIEKREGMRLSLEAHYPSLCPALIAEDRAEVAKCLHELEAKTIKNLKLSKYWESTPFPLEREATQ
ncbi:hypothetical protein AB4Y96_00220 [Phyllobacterium sp. TAF24]|uniref:hypothetical protein n=1 Tax=Phyllobacterium sp. TAF24 TaxID=3233068 RepID=UPI003F98E5E1